MRRFRFYAMTLVAALFLQGIAAAGAFAASADAPILIAAAGSGPTVQTLYPADNAVSVPMNAKLVMQFSEAVTPGSGTITIKNSSTFATAASYDVNSSNIQVSASGTFVTITVEANKLQTGTGYYVQVSPGAFKGPSGDYAGITDALSWNFQTAYSDMSAPSAISFTPSNNTTVADLSSSLVVKFNESVLPGSGSIQIRDLSAGTTYDSIPANSAQVTGVGTDTITIRPYKSLKANLIYAINIDKTAFTDMSGNAYAGIDSTNTTTWRFTTTTDSTPPDLLETTPTSGANYVSLNGVLKMRFSEPVQIKAGAKGTAIPTTGSTGNVNLILGPDNASIPDPNVVTLTPSSAFTGKLSYVVHIPADAITDAAGNFFPGILNDYRWTFQTIGSDTSAPSLSSATMDGAVILLTYNEPLDETSIPYASNFYVTVNDVPRQVNAVSVSGSQVRLTMQSGVAVGQTVKLSYTVGDAPLRDLSANSAAGFTNKAVSNTTTTTLPKPDSGSVSGNTLTLVFNKTLQSVSSYASSQFSVKVNGSAVSINGISVSGTNVILMLSSSVSTGQIVSVSYTPGWYPVQDTSGNAVAAFADFYLQNASDTTPPTVSSASVSGNNVSLNYNEGLNASLVPLRSSFSVLVNGVSNQVTAVSVTNNTVKLTLTSAVSSANIVLVTYIPGSPAITDLAGNAAAGFSNYQVVSGSTTGATLSSASVNGSVLTLAYSANLNASSVPNPLQFVVNADGSYVSVSKVSISGSNVTLTLGSAIKGGQTVLLTYYNSGTPLMDANNQTMAGINNMSVLNQSSTVDNLPSYAGTDGEGGLQLDASAATKASGTTPSGQIANRYILNSDKFIQAFASLKSNASQLTNQQVTFAVPASENGALVSIPVSSIVQAASMISNASFRLEYGGTSYSIPLSAINFTQELALAGWSPDSTSLYLAIEKTSDSQLTGAISSAGGSLMATPAAFAASLSAGGSEREIQNFNQYAVGSFVLSAGSASASELLVVRYDSDYGDLTYVPTKTETQNGELNVRFMGKGNGSFAVVRKDKQVYSDMANHWAKNDVAALGAKFIVTTPTPTTFAPSRNITRMEFAEFIARGLGLTGDKSAATRFPDVSSGSAGAGYIGAVSEAGIVQGDEKGRFNPNASITREEMATMMMRAMTYAGTQPTASAAVLSKYSDRGKIGSWASSAVAANVQAGIMNGVSDTQFQPKANATRAEAAAMVKRFLEYADLFEG
ncbi:SwmB domain-containing protein [Cohnella zeiphila]|uniref:Ig-like domain-containing protein n=1 Tax=Cohnella zeiphila TaxID=2761120 RepID=A0A7X0SR00_9BACL|nr:SwmB domain-containing protein [Cohnella zeiphila]MBB6732288.1 Ig-like domain-containing protein [Cohnella zeiphila]